MKVYSIYILNKSGGLIYQQDLNPGLNKLTSNDYLVLAGTLHGVHAIGSQLNSMMGPPSNKNQENSNATLIASERPQNPNTNKSGVQSIETDLFSLYIFQSLTGYKFIIVTLPNPVVHNVQESKTGGRGELESQYSTVSELYKKIYLCFSDYVMKDPFYSLEMPIKSSLFDSKVRTLVQ